MPLSSLSLLFSLGAVWGASFLCTKIGVTDLGPFTFATLRVLIGALVLLAVILLRRQAWPRDARTHGHFAFMGLLGITIPFAAIAWGTQYIASGLSAILNATMPLFTFVLVVLLGDEGLSWRRAVGLLIGFLGIVVLTWPKLQAGIRSELLGQLAIVVASLSYAVAIIYARRHLTHQPPLVTALGQVAMGCLFFAPLALAEAPWAQSFTWRAMGAASIVGVLGTGVAYIIYYRLVRDIGPTGTSLVTYIVPLFGIAWGWAILSEALSWHAFVALALIFAGLIFVNGLPQVRRRG
jgi:drug/metabolite transporter (DMT)-like permease